MRTKRMLRRGLTALAAALAMMTALAAPAFAYTGDSADSTAETAAQQSSASQTAVQTERIGTVTTNGGRLNLLPGGLVGIAVAIGQKIVLRVALDGMTGVVPDAALHDDQIARLHQKRNNVHRLRHAVGITVCDAQNDGLVAGKENLFG